MQFLLPLSSRSGQSAARCLSTLALAGVLLLGVLALGGQSARADSITITGNIADTTLSGPNASRDGSTNAIGISVDAANSLNVDAGVSNGTGKNAIFVFQLPTLFNQQVSSANLTLGLSSASFTNGDGNTQNIDVYGLGFRSTSTVLTSDYYFGTSDATNATLIQDNYVGNTNGSLYNFSSQPPLSAAGMTSLSSYLNAQYAAGAGGNYVFVRLNPDTVAGSSSTTFNFRATDDSSSRPPVLTFNTVAAVPEPSTWAMMALGVGVLGLIACHKRSEALHSTDLADVAI